MFDPEEMRRIEVTLTAASDERYGLAYAFYEELFDELPAARLIFDGDLADHAPRFMGIVQAIPLAVEMPDEMCVALRSIGAEHHGMGVRPAHYPPMVNALMRALARNAGKAWNEAASDAWWRFLNLARAQMLEGWAAEEGRQQARA